MKIKAQDYTESSFVTTTTSAHNAIAHNAIDLAAPAVVVLQIFKGRSRTMRFISTEATGARQHHDSSQSGPDADSLLSLRLGASVEHVA
jgi:hypothetical protein